MHATQTASRQHEAVPQFSPDRLKAFIGTHLSRGRPLTQIANAVRYHFGIALDPESVVSYWKGEVTLPTQTGPAQTERRQDKESQQFPADAANEPLVTCDTVPEPAPVPFSITLDSVPVLDAARGDDAGATQTGRRQDKESLHPADEIGEPLVASMTPGALLQALDARVKARRGIAPDPAQPCDGARGKAARPTQTGRRQNQKTQDQKAQAPKAPSVLTDAVKAFIVRGLARYETPTQVAAVVKAEFGIEIHRRQVFAYDPEGSRPPAQRWIDLHAATRAKFLRDMAVIGIAQKVVRLRMLDRFAQHADEGNYTERAARFLVLAARECGGFYERYARPQVAPTLTLSAPVPA